MSAEQWGEGTLLRWATRNAVEHAAEVLATFMAAAKGSPSRERAARLTNAVLAVRGLPVAKLTVERQRDIAVKETAQWLRRLRDAEDSDCAPMLQELCGVLAVFTKDNKFWSVRVGRADVSVARGRVGARRLAAWLTLRAGALGERRKDAPDGDDLRSLTKVFAKAQEKSGKSLARTRMRTRV
jgi:hypothetical protein